MSATIERGEAACTEAAPVRSDSGSLPASLWVLGERRRLVPRSREPDPVDGMLHHASLPVEDLDRAAALYDAALAPLGYRRVCSGPGFAGYGVEDGKDKLALKQTLPSASAGPGFHIALAAPSRDAVDAFHRAALENGATDNGEAGLRPHYGSTYYAAFIIDLDGHRVEAVHDASGPPTVSGSAGHARGLENRSA